MWDPASTWLGSVMTVAGKDSLRDSGAPESRIQSCRPSRCQDQINPMHTELLLPILPLAHFAFKKRGSRLNIHRAGLLFLLSFRSNSGGVGLFLLSFRSNSGGTGFAGLKILNDIRIQCHALSCDLLNNVKIFQSK